MEAFLLSTFLSARRETALLPAVGNAFRYEMAFMNAREDRGEDMVIYRY